MHFTRQHPKHSIAQPRLKLTLAIALALTFGCTNPSTSLTANPIGETSIAAPSPDPPIRETSDAPDDLPAQAETIALEGSEVEMLRREALETAIVDNNLTPLVSYCRMGECMSSYYTFNNLVQEAGRERLYEAEILTQHSAMGETEGEWILAEAPTQILCSTERPTAVDFAGNEYIINHLSPGVSPSSFQAEVDALYWALCHNISASQLAETGFRASQARRLGYDLNREANQTRQTSVRFLD
ncbi:MAG: hypothetical protein F6K32_03035 [Desertifilum sp. SIO1I2]|nr:hypothetical protein [Desertifilum sp. SIO1I2]